MILGWLRKLFARRRRRADLLARWKSLRKRHRRTYTKRGRRIIDQTIDRCEVRVHAVVTQLAELHAESHFVPLRRDEDRERCISDSEAIAERMVDAFRPWSARRKRES